MSEVQKFDWGSFVFGSRTETAGPCSRFRRRLKSAGLNPAPAPATIEPCSAAHGGPRRQTFRCRLASLTFGLGLAVGVAVVGLVWLYLSRGDDIGALEQDPASHRHEYAYLDNPRVLVYLGQIEGGRVIERDAHPQCHGSAPAALRQAASS